VSDVVNVAAINPHSCVNPAAAGDAKNPPVDTEGWISIRVSTANQIAAKSIHQSKWRQPHGHQAAQRDWWVKERQQWLGRVRGKDGRQRWLRAVDLRPAKGE
jgi:hypothetical protein